MWENPKLQTLPTNADIYTVNPISSLPDQKISASTRQHGMGSTPAGQMPYNTMYNPDHDRMVGYDGKFDAEGKLHHYTQERMPGVKLPPPPWQPKDGMQLSHEAANANGIVPPIDPRLWGPGGEFGSDVAGKAK